MQLDTRKKMSVALQFKTDVYDQIEKKYSLLSVSHGKEFNKILIID